MFKIDKLLKVIQSQSLIIVINIILHNFVEKKNSAKRKD